MATHRDQCMIVTMPISLDDLTPELRHAVIRGMELVGVAEIAEELDVERPRVSMWANRRESSGFPEPLIHVAAGPIYDMAEVRAWFDSKYGEREL